MLEMRPVYTSYERKEYTRVFGIIPEDDKVVICARYPDKFVGLAYIKIDGVAAEVLKLCLIDGYSDSTDIFLLGKAMLNYMDLKGVKTVNYKNPDDIKNAERLGFKKSETGVFILSLEGYFTGHKH